NADPDGPWPARVAEAADSFHAHRERSVLLTAVSDGAADGGHIAVVDLAEEQQGDVQVFRLDPLDLAAGPGERLLQCNGLVADGLAEVESDEGAQAFHARCPLSVARCSLFVVGVVLCHGQRTTNNGQLLPRIAWSRGAGGHRAE